MSVDPCRRGRPRGELRAILDGWLREHPSFTMGQMSRSMGWPVPVANRLLQRSLESGEVRVCGAMRVPEAKRPVMLYESAAVQRTPLPLAQLMRVWS